jgi:hypothetical protein
VLFHILELGAGPGGEAGGAHPGQRPRQGAFTLNQVLSSYGQLE